MTDGAKDEGLRVGKWGAGVASALLIAATLGGVTQLVAGNRQMAQTDAKIEVMAVRIESMKEAMDSIKETMEAQAALLTSLVADRWTGEQQSTYAAQVDAKIESVRFDLREHAHLPWHVQAGAEHGETKRRVDRLEAELAALRERLDGQ